MSTNRSVRRQALAYQAEHHVQYTEALAAILKKESRRLVTWNGLPLGTVTSAEEDRVIDLDMDRLGIYGTSLSKRTEAVTSLIHASINNGDMVFVNDYSRSLSYDDIMLSNRVVASGGTREDCSTVEFIFHSVMEGRISRLQELAVTDPNRVQENFDAMSNCILVVHNADYDNNSISKLLRDVMHRGFSVKCFVVISDDHISRSVYDMPVGLLVGGQQNPTGYAFGFTEEITHQSSDENKIVIPRKELQAIELTHTDLDEGDPVHHNLWISGVQFGVPQIVDLSKPENDEYNPRSPLYFEKKGSTTFFG